MVPLGSEVRDELTGLKGTAIGRSAYLHGCAQIWIQPKGLKDGLPIQSYWVDEQRIKVLKIKNVQVSKDSSATSGGPQQSPPVKSPR